MNQLDLFPEDDTLITCNTPDGSKIQFDVTELEALSNSCFVDNKEIPYDDYINMMRELFLQKYGYKMSIISMRQLVSIKNDIIDKIKKNISTQLEQSDSMASNQPADVTS